MCKIIDAHVHVNDTEIIEVSMNCKNMNYESTNYKSISYENAANKDISRTGENYKTISNAGISKKNKSHRNTNDINSSNKNKDAKKESFLSMLQENCIYCIINSDNSYEYEMLRQTKTENMIISAGIHPWKADITDWNEMESVLQRAEVIGEIGLDCVWCEVDLDIQRSVFFRQLELAMQLKKPVVLHTKGMEKEILETIQKFPNRYLVHWYSCENYLEEYMKLGCWFTIGPSIRQDKIVEMIARKVPINRLLIESDGLDGISWGQNREIKAADYKNAMKEHLSVLAEIRGLETEQLLEQMRQNLKSFIWGDEC